MKNTNILMIAGILVVILSGIFIFWRTRTLNPLPGANTNLNGTNGSQNPNQSGSSSNSTTQVNPQEQQLVLSVTLPVDKSVVTTSTVVVKGKTSPNAEVFVSDKETKADKDGNFSVSVSLDEGDNVLDVVANDDSGNSAEKEITVTYEPTS